VSDAEGPADTTDPGDELDCEIHVPISPTPAFFNQVRLLAASIRRFGGPLRDSRIVVTVGGEGPHTDLASWLPWSREYGVEWRWLDPELFARHNYWGTAIERFREPFESKYVLFLDADVLAISPPELASSPVTETGGLAGVIAYAAPFDPPVSSVAGWTELMKAAGLGAEPPLVARHSWWGLADWDPERQYAPPYFNLGVLFCSSDTARALSVRLYEEMAIVDRVRDTRFKCQIALTLAILRLGVPWYELPVRLNFPNHLPSWRARGAEVERLQLLHYSTEDELNRVVDFASEDALRALVARPVGNPLNRLLQERIQMLLFETGGDDR
jgi:hypothetical protein